MLAACRVLLQHYCSVLRRLNIACWLVATADADMASRVSHDELAGALYILQDGVPGCS
jgi:hypothetical protein